MHCDEEEEEEPKDTGLGQSKRSVPTVREIGLDECIDGIVDGIIKPSTRLDTPGGKRDAGKPDVAAKEEKKPKRSILGIGIDEYINGICDGTIQPTPSSWAKQTEEARRKLDVPLQADAKQAEPKPKRSIRHYGIDEYIDGICDGTIDPREFSRSG
jgi:hypothetical protein